MTYLKLKLGIIYILSRSTTSPTSLGGRGGGVVGALNPNQEEGGQLQLIPVSVQLQTLPIAPACRNRGSAPAPAKLRVKVESKSQSGASICSFLPTKVLP